jgi:hypothetical protein
MGLYKFWTVSNKILYHSSNRTSSSCFRDIGCGNLFLALASKTDHSGSMMLKSHYCDGQGRHWSSPSCSSNHDWTVPAVRKGTLLSWILHHSFRKYAWIMRCTWLPNLSMYSLTVIWPWRVIMGPTEYCTTILLPKPSQNLHCVSLLEPGTPDCKASLGVLQT